MVMNEIWKVIPGYENYEVSNLGRVKGPLKMLKPTIVEMGKKTKKYYQVCNLSKLGKVKKFYIHQLVAYAFLSYKDKKDGVIDHIDNNGLNNDLKNLQVITQRENSSKDRFRIDSTSKYIGVYYNKTKRTYQSYIYIDGKLKYLGSSKDEEFLNIIYKNKVKEISHNK